MHRLLLYLWRDFLSYRTGISVLLRSPAMSGTGDGSLRRSRLAEFGCDDRSFAADPEGCCVGRVWHGRAAAGSRLALGSSRSSGGHTESGIVVKIHLDITTLSCLVLH